MLRNLIYRLNAAGAAFKNPQYVADGAWIAGAMEGLALRQDLALLEPRVVDGIPYPHIIQLPYAEQELIRRCILRR